MLAADGRRVVRAQEDPQVADDLAGAPAAIDIGRPRPRLGQADELGESFGFLHGQRGVGRLALDQVQRELMLGMVNEAASSSSTPTCESCSA